jgi:hypothetical protein
MFVKSYVGRDCGSRVQIWCTSMVAIELPEGVYADGREEDEVWRPSGVLQCNFILC